MKSLPRGCGEETVVAGLFSFFHVVQEIRHQRTTVTDSPHDLNVPNRIVIGRPSNRIIEDQSKTFGGEIFLFKQVPHSLVHNQTTLFSSVQPLYSSINFQLYLLRSNHFTSLPPAEIPSQLKPCRESTQVTLHTSHTATPHQKQRLANRCCCTTVYTLLRREER